MHMYLCCLVFRFSPFIELTYLWIWKGKNYFTHREKMLKSRKLQEICIKWLVVRTPNWSYEVRATVFPIGTGMGRSWFFFSSFLLWECLRSSCALRVTMGVPKSSSYTVGKKSTYYNIWKFENSCIALESFSPVRCMSLPYVPHGLYFLGV